jgi:hypothetical protein
MSNWANSQPFRQSLGACLLLLVCATSLAVHFSGEGMNLARRGPAIEMTDPGEDTHPFPESYEDDLVTSFSRAIDIEQARPWQIIQNPVFIHSVLISPLLPPPNS